MKNNKKAFNTSPPKNIIKKGDEDIEIDLVANEKLEEIRKRLKEKRLFINKENINEEIRNQVKNDAITLEMSERIHKII